MIKHPWFKFYADDWLTGTMDITLEEEGAYLRVVALIFSKEGPIPDNDRWLAGMCRISVRKWRIIKKCLVESGKIDIEGNLISNARASKELRERAENSLKASRAADERWRKNSDRNDQASEKQQNEGCERITDAYAESMPTRTRKKERKISAAKHAALGNSSTPNTIDLSDPKTQLYHRGKEVLGKSGAGQITKLLAALDDNVPRTRAAIETASTKAEPRSYVAKMINLRTEEISDVPPAAVLLDNKGRPMRNPDGSWFLNPVVTL